MKRGHSVSRCHPKGSVRAGKKEAEVMAAQGVTEMKTEWQEGVKFVFS